MSGRAATKLAPHSPEWKLHKAFVKKLQAIREAKGVTVAQMFKQLGISKRVGNSMLYHDRELPDKELQSRLIQWAFHNKSWENAPSLKLSRRWTRALAKKWPSRKVFFPPALWRRMVAKSKELGYSTEALIYLALDRLLNDEPTLVTLKQAIAEAEKARVSQVLSENPLLLEFLKSEVPLVKQIAENTVVQNVEDVYEDVETGVERIANTYVEDGPASLVYCRDEHGNKRGKGGKESS